MKHSPGFLRITEDARSRVKEVSAAEAMRIAEQDGSAALIDVREESEFAAAHVAGAEHIGKGVLERDIEKRHPDPNQKLLLYCGGGYRSALSCDNLQKMGYTNVFSVAGGFAALKECGAKIE